MPQLTAAILARLAAPHGRSAPQPTAGAIDALAAYQFPGNVRELENILERAMAMADGDQIDAADLRLPQGNGHGGRGAPVEVPALADEAPLAGIDPGAGALPSYIEQLERAAIQKALEDNRWNKTKAAAQLGITFRALRYKLKKLGME